MSQKKEPAWYDKAAGRRQHKAENTAKIAARAEAKAAAKEKAASEGKKSSSPKNDLKSNLAKSKNRNTGRTAGNSYQKKDSRRTPLFNSDAVPKDAIQILNTFDSIVSETRNLSGKQQTLLAGQIKKLSHSLTDDRSSRRVGYMNDASSVSAYIYYFMWWNLVRLTRLFASLPADCFKLNDNDVCLDLGSGPLTIPVALWLARPELRAKKLKFYCVDLSQTALAAGEEIFYSVAAKTIAADQEPWTIIRVKGAVGAAIKEKATLITSGNVFNELAQTSEMQSDYLAKKYTGDIEKYFASQESVSAESKPATQTVIVIEPGDPHSARLVSLMRNAFIRRNFVPIAPCPHSLSCPMEGRTSSNPSGKWCNFAFDTENAPAALLKLSEKANLTKERAVLSFIVCRRSSDNQSPESDKKTMNIRVASDFIKLPEIKKSGYYCCSDMGLLLAVDTTNIRPVNGDLLKVQRPALNDRPVKDKKSGALIIEI